MYKSKLTRCIDDENSCLIHGNPCTRELLTTTGKTAWIPIHPELFNLEKRLLTYKTAPKILQDFALDLSLAGLFFTGFVNTVRCFYCGKGIFDFEEGDIPLTQHRKYNPGCLFIQMIAG